MATPLDNLIDTEPLRFAGQVKMPSHYSDQDFDLHCFVDTCGSEHVALTLGNVAGGKNVLTRVHSECLTGDVFHSARCDCGDQLNKAMHAIVEEGTGLLIYLRQEGRGIGLVNKIKAYRLQDRGFDTVDANEHLGFPADPRVYTAAAEIVAALQVHSIRLLTNNPKKMAGLTECGVKITERIPLIIPAKAQNEFYLQTKRDRLGHIL
jgi:GTP cyclohydrolase II